MPLNHSLGELEEITQSLDDPWSAHVLDMNSDNDLSLIVHDYAERVRLYLMNILMLWRLGIKPIR